MRLAQHELLSFIRWTSVLVSLLASTASIRFADLPSEQNDRRAIAERTGHQELTAIRRQQAQWQREASRDFAGGNSGAALNRYREHGAIRFAATRAQAKDRLIGDWADQRDSHPEKCSLILAHTRADVTELNQRARAVLKQRGELAPEVKVETWREITRDDASLPIERGERVFAPGDVSEERSRARR